MMDSRLNEYVITASANSLCTWTLLTAGMACIVARFFGANDDLGPLGLGIMCIGHLRAMSGMMNRLRKLERNAFELGRDSAHRHLSSVKEPVSGGDRH